MGLLFRKVFLSVVFTCLGFICFVGVSGKAEAGIIPNSVIVPHEYQFPPAAVIPPEGFTGILSYNIFRDEGEAYEGESNMRNLFASVNKVYHIFNVKGLDNVGFAWEGLFGYARALTKTDQSFNGMLDVQMGGVAFMKPTKNWTTALEYWLVLPIGDNDFSGHSWDHQFAFLTNYVYENFTFDGDIGYKLRGDSKHNGLHSENGDTLYGSACFGYKVAKLIEPFFKLDFQSTATGKDMASGQKTSSQAELTWGVGNYFKLTDKLQLSVHYIGGLTGSHNTKANGAEFNLYLMF